MIFVGDGDFKKTGQEFFSYFLEIGGLKPDEKVLDVGCGIGRMAVPLTKYLDKRGAYEGFDIAADGINWCRKRITPRYSNFSFRLADVFNKSYNPQGKYKASEYRFPYDNKSFDFIFLTSVFTHMLPRDMESYLSEIARVLKSGGRCFITFFLLNTESEKLIDAKLSTLDFKYDIGGCRTVNKDAPEFAVAYAEGFIQEISQKYGLKVREPIQYGVWCGRNNFLSYQDIIIAVKE
ncbi:MAG: class I SAM-dependent methyltransferase [Candidatus Brocadiia bacterium]